MYESQPWADHLAGLQWHQGEHVLLCGPTGSGKTTLMSTLVRRRGHVVVFVSKTRDPVFQKEFKGWERLSRWPRRGPRPYQRRILLWPDQQPTIKETVAHQRAVFAHAIEDIFDKGNRCVVVDEMLYFADPKFIGLSNPIGALHYQGRSSGVSMVTLSQRPAWIPKVIYSSVSHAYLARTTDALDLRRLSDLGGIDTKAVRTAIPALADRHDYLYVNPHGDSAPAIVNTRK